MGRALGSYDPLLDSPRNSGQDSLKGVNFFVEIAISLQIKELRPKIGFSL